jgi:ribosomal protein L31
MKQSFKKFGLIILALLLSSGIVYSQSVFKITPKYIKKTNGTVLTPEMSIIVTTSQHTSDPFYNGAKEIKEAYMRLYSFDYQKANCNKNDFDFVRLDNKNSIKKPETNKSMSKVFKVTPKRVKKTNGTVLTPEMSITVTTSQYTSDPFYNGAKEIKETYKRLYGFDYQKANCNKNDFNFVKLD